MGQAVRAAQNMASQHHAAPWPGPSSGPYPVYQPSMHVRPRPLTHVAAPFPPCPPNPLFASQVSSVPSPPNIPASQPSQPHTLTPPGPPTPPRHSPSIPSSCSPSGSTPGSHRIPTSSSHPRIFGFDLNEHWQQDSEYYDNQKINGLTLPRTIRSSAFTQKLDIEGCDPLSLPIAALLYQQANNHWLRKLASGREMYVIPTGDIASVVFLTELIKQFQTRGIDVDRIAMTKARQDGKLTDKTNNTKHIAQVVAQYMQSWIPVKSADPESQHEITQLRQQLAELRQRVGDTASPAEAPSSSCPAAPPATIPPIQRSLQGNAAPAPSAFEPQCLLTIPGSPNPWLSSHLPTSLKPGVVTNWLNKLKLPQAQLNTIQSNWAKVQSWWQSQPASAVDTIQRVAVMSGVSVSLLQKNFDAEQLLRVLTIAISMAN